MAYELRGLGSDPLPPVVTSWLPVQPDHSDQAQDAALLEAALNNVLPKALAVQGAVMAVVILGGMYFIEEYWGRH